MAHNKRDIICKSTVEDHPEDMLRFFYPGAEKIFDFSRGFEWLNIELSDLNPGTKDIKDSKLADRVLKVYTISGDLVYIVICIEFQGYYDPDFYERMFSYYYRLYDKYGNRVTLLAIYTDKAAERCAAVFESSLLNTDIHFGFMPYKVWEQDEEALLQSDNPYAFVILIIKSGRNASQEQRLSKGESIANCIMEKQFSDFAKRKLLDFMGLYFDFGDTDLRAKFDAIIYTFTIKINDMGIFELKEMFAREEGELKGKITSAKNMLKLGFDFKIIQKVTELPISEIKKLAL